MIRVEEHPYGPRVYVLGQRVHEVALGLAVLGVIAALVVGRLVNVGDELIPFVAFGLWLVWKDWRDLVPRWRNTSHHRRLGLHRPAGRACRPAAPRIAAAGTLTIALAEVIALVVPATTRAAELAAQVAPASSYALAIPLAGALVPVAFGLADRRRDAMVWAIALLGGLAATLTVDAHRYERALVCAGLAALLAAARDAFPVEREEASRSQLLLAVGLVAAAVFPLGILLQGGRGDVVTAVAGVLCAAGFAGAMRLALGRARPLVERPGARERARAAVRERGSDTLDAFKLRRDARYLHSPSGGALLAYRISAGVMIVAGDPVGPRAEVPALIEHAREVAARHGLTIAVLNVGARAATAWRKAGLRGIYLGDEAIVDTHAFSLEGRAIRKVRQSVTRLGKAGYTSELLPVASLVPQERADLAELTDRWRGEAPERGFTMACTIDEPAADDGLVAIARDGDGAPRAVLLLLPAYGNDVCSLGLMRRDVDTPNGLTEFLVADTVAALHTLGIRELSLNFAVLGRCLREGSGLRLGLVRRLVRIGDRWFQLERLQSFNEKFFPRWQPRYLFFEGVPSLPRTALSALHVEGFLRTPRLSGTRAPAARDVA